MLLLPVLANCQLIGYWNQDGNANDLLGNYNLSASNVTYASGKFVQHGIFVAATPSSEYVAMNTNLDGDFTINAWINLTSLPADGGGFYTIASSSVTSYNNYWISLAVYTGIESGHVAKFHIGMYNGSKNPYVFAFQPSIDTWYMVTGRRTGGKIYLYVNGVEVGNASDQSITKPTYTTWSIGYQYRGSNRPMNGNIDEVKLFKLALTVAGIKNLYSFYKGYFQ